MNAGTALPIWPNLPPGALGEDSSKDIPTLTPYLPPPGIANGTAVVVCPGGGYGGLADYEGRDYALWLNERGIAAFVLKYRLGSHGYRHPHITGDLTRAIRYLRLHAAEFGIDSARLGVMGSSAGGHLASVALTHFDGGNVDHADPVERMGSRPAFGILCYAVISMVQHPEPGSRRNLFGESYPAEWNALLSGELQVRPETPPCFIWHTQDDVVVRVEHALLFAAALQARGISYALHIYPSGVHGLGLGIKGYHPETDRAQLHPWTFELERWLRHVNAMA